MKATGHLLALAKIFDCVEGGNKNEEFYNKTLAQKEALNAYRRDKTFQYKTFLEDEITEAVSKNKAKVNTEDVIKNLSDLKSLFFSVKDFKENCKDLKDAGAISDDDYENIKQIFKKSLTYETVVEVSKKLLQALIENAGAQNIDLEAIKTEAGPESENSKSLYVLVKTQLNSEELTNLVEKEDEEEALSDDGDSIEEESEEISAKSDEKAKSDKKAKLVDFVKEVITKYQSKASDTLDGVLDKLR